jgi:pSer/pThr/pTyr-binding forkhead associated (FHA) protein
MPKLLIQNLKTHEEQEYSLSQDTIVFGRTNTCDIELPQKAISRKHAEITREAEDYFLTDLNSGNGTFLNNNKIHPREKNLLRSGDLIRIEDYEIRFLLTDDAAELPAEEDTDSDIIEIKLIKKMLNALDTEENPTLEVLTGVAAGKKIKLSDQKEMCIIGRDENADLSIDENVISREHAKLEKKWGGIVITDLDSKNGTFVNNERVKEKLLRDGDKVMLGTVKLLYRNPLDVNIDKISQEISKKKREAAMREAEALAEKQRKEEKIAEDAAAQEQAKQEAEAKAVEQALTKEEASLPSPIPQAAPSPAEATETKGKFSTMEKIMIALGIVVGAVAIIGLIVLLLK